MELELYQWQQDVVDAINDNNYVVVKKKRNSGFTTVAFYIANQYLKDNKTVAFISSRSSEMHKNNFQDIFGTIDSNCFFLFYEDIKHNINLVQGVDLVIFDEMAFYDLQISFVEFEGKILIGSTPSVMANKNNFPNLFYRIWTRDNEFIKIDHCDDGTDFIDQPKRTNPKMSSSPIEINQEEDGTFSLNFNTDENQMFIEGITEEALDVFVSRYLNIKKKNELNFALNNINHYRGLFNSQEDVDYFRRSMAEIPENNILNNNN
jgi:hypothetical protein